MVIIWKCSGGMPQLYKLATPLCKFSTGQATIAQGSEDAEGDCVSVGVAREVSEEAKEGEKSGPLR